MNLPVSDEKLIAACGLYCGSCRSLLSGKCPGCAGNEKASWCKIRSCCGGKAILSCAECDEHEDPSTCNYFDNLVSKIFGLLFNSNRAACVMAIRADGREKFADRMAAEKRQSLPRK